VDGVDTIYAAEQPPLHPEDVNGIKKTQIWYGWEGGKEGGRNMGCGTLNPFGFYSLSRKLSLSITTSTDANHLIR